MGDTEDVLIRIVKELAEIRARMKEIATRLREAFPSAAIQHAIDFSKYEDSFFPERVPKYVIECFIEIAFPDGKYLCWWIDVNREERIWKVEASLKRSKIDGEESLWKATYAAVTTDELFEHFATVFQEIERFARQRGEKFI